MNDPDDTRATGELTAIRRLLEQLVQPLPALIDRKALASLLSVGLTTLDTMRAAGKVGPAEVPVGGGIRWHADEVRAWLAHRDHRDGLYDATTWPAVWKEVRRR